MNKYYATLCLDMGNACVEIHAPDEATARQMMFESAYGERWAFMYPESKKAEAIDRFNTPIIKVIK